MKSGQAVLEEGEGQRLHAQHADEAFDADSFAQGAPQEGDAGPADLDEGPLPTGLVGEARANVIAELEREYCHDSDEDGGAPPPPAPGPQEVPRPPCTPPPNPPRTPPPRSPRGRWRTGSSWRRRC